MEELLDAGIDVWSTLNVQHLESLNDVVGAITGVRVHETVPDTVLDGADEVVLVDLTPDELLQRLKAGKVYLPQQAERAAQNFFRKGNLIALRELALRRTADRVEDDVRSYRVEQSHRAGLEDREARSWPASGPREGAEQTVRAAARLAGQLDVRWHAVYVETPQLQRLPAARARPHPGGAQAGARSWARPPRCWPATTPRPSWWRTRSSSTARCWWSGRPRARAAAVGPGAAARMTRRLAALAPALDIVEVGAARQRAPAGARWCRRAPRTRRRGRAGCRGWPRYAWAAAGCVAVTLLATPLRDVLDLANIVMLFLLGGGAAWRCASGRGPAVLAAFLNVAAFDFFFVRAAPVVRGQRRAVPASPSRVMLVVGLVIGQLTAGLRFQARVAASRERRAQSLFELTRDLSAALLREQVVELGEAAVQRHFGGAGAWCWPPMRATSWCCPRRRRPGFDASVADWAFRNGAARRPGHRHAGRAALALRAAEGADARARRAGAAARAAALAADARAARSSWTRWRARSPSRWSACTTSRSRSRRWSRWSRSGCATRCWPRSRTTCARR